jgi:hypothetical protein
MCAITPAMKVRFANKVLADFIDAFILPGSSTFFPIPASIKSKHFWTSFPDNKTGRHQPFFVNLLRTEHKSNQVVNEVTAFRASGFLGDDSIHSETSPSLG